MPDNIYIFTNTYKALLGGVQTVMSQLAEVLAAKGQKVIVVMHVVKEVVA